VPISVREAIEEAPAQAELGQHVVVAQEERRHRRGRRLVAAAVGGRAATREMEVVSKGEEAVVAF